MRGPDDNYDSQTKTAYRRKIWDALERTNALSVIPAAERKVLLLDESGALEALFLIRRGYSPYNLTIANLKTATIAHASRKLKRMGIAGVTCKGGDVGEIWTRAADKGKRFNVIHLDFCQNVGNSVIETLEAFNGAAALGPTAFATNVLRGREYNDLFSMRHDAAVLTGLDTERAMDYARRKEITSHLCSVAWSDRVICRQHLTNPESGRYISTNGQSFMWICGTLMTHGDAIAMPSHLDWLCDSWDHMANIRAKKFKRTGGILEWASPTCLATIASMPKEEQIQAVEHLLKNNEVGKEMMITAGEMFARRMEQFQSKILDGDRWQVGSKLKSMMTKRIQRESKDPRRQIPMKYQGEEIERIDLGGISLVMSRRKNGD